MPPMGITVLDLSAYAARSWPHRRFNYFRFHNWTGYITLAVVSLHPVILLFSKNPRLRILDLVYPVHSPTQPLDNTIGAMALYLLAFVVVTSYLRIRQGRHLWKAFHLSILFCRRRAFLAQPNHRSRLEKCPPRLVRWRQTLRRHQPAAPAPSARKGYPHPPNRSADSHVSITSKKAFKKVLSPGRCLLIYFRVSGMEPM